MKLELTKEEISIINELCFAELLELGKLQHNKFIDKNQIESYMNKIGEIMNKTIIDE